jgi:hypothetical protein
MAVLVTARLKGGWRASRKPSLPLKSIKVKFKLPGTEIEGTWEPDETERWAAWELYVELVTRTTVVDLKDDEGSLREALSSYHSLFDTTRRILRQYGPAVAIPKPGSNVSFGQLAVPVLNQVLRPVLGKWHPLLTDWEKSRNEKGQVSPIEHERNWPHNQELRDILRAMRPTLTAYSRILEEVAEVPSLIGQRRDK